MLCWNRNDFLYSAKQRKTERSTLKGLLDEYNQTHSKKFTAFDPTLTAVDYEMLWGTNLNWLRGATGSTFLSNYNRTVHTTPFHSAFFESYGYQCEGTKRWLMMTPEDALPTVRLHTIFTSMKQCENREDIKNLTFWTRSDPDTMFYFPPFWAHSVETQKGLSILLNYRAINVRRILKDNFMLGVLTMAGLAQYLTVFNSWDPDEVNYYFLTGKDPASGGRTDRLQKSGLVLKLED